MFLLLSILFPVLAGFCLLVRKQSDSFTRKRLLCLTGIFLGLTAVFVTASLFPIREYSVLAFDGEIICFHIDGMGRIFAMLTTVIFVCGGVFSFEYMKHEEKEKRYYGFYLIVYGVMNGSCFAGNLITFYLFFELLTLTSFPLVLHNESKEAVMAGLKYLFYSFCGAYAALFGIFFLNKYCDTLTFAEYGVLNAAASEHKELLLIAAFVMILGFGVKAGMFPMHAWLPTAHPVAPAPASAILSAVIVKAGVLGIIRVVYNIFGVAFLSGSWVQTAWLILTLITVFIGSMLAYREPVLKKRLAYSTVSQLSYILFGLAVMDTESAIPAVVESLPDGVLMFPASYGGILHVLSHGLIKAGLFLCAGAIIYTTGRTRVDEMRGIGKKMPLTMWCYTLLSLGLIGIPPTGGFISKWYLALGSLYSGIPVFNWLGPVILLVSALLTAGYLLPPTIQGFLPGEDFDYTGFKKQEPSKFMTIPILILTVLSVLIGLLPFDMIRNLW